MADDALRTLEYLDASGQSPFARWFDRLNPAAAAKVTIACIGSNMDISQM
jgi:hypothetical protein